ncbi:MAG TPA: sialidase family protein [Actinomycetota bacterium]|nr:sialidase family protein [Actinomycetota bacterium]
MGSIRFLAIRIGRRSIVSSAVAGALLFASLPPVAGAVLPSVAETNATNLGFCGGDDWEPEIAASGRDVYVGIAHFPGDPSCDPASAGPREIYVRSSADGGRTFGPLVALPRLGYPNVVDVVVTIDEVTHAVYVSFLAFGTGFATDVLVAKSTDHGATWTTTKVNGPLCTACDHPWLVANDDNVYVMYASGKNHFLSRSADGGATWSESLVLQDAHVAFPEGAVLDAAGNAWFAWGDCFGSCTGKTAAIYQVSKTTAGTSETAFARVAEGSAGPHCPPSVACGFAYWGPQDDVAIDAAGNLYLVWQDNLPNRPGRPPIVQLSSCSAGTDCTDSANWHYVGRVDDKTASGCAGGNCYALYPRVEGGSAGEISVIWMDDRLGEPLDHNNGWNVWYRTSTNGGLSWTGPSVRVSQFDSARSESHANGFEFPYGDYQGIDLLESRAVMVWGEGHNYVGGPTSPGHVIYRSLLT